MRLVYVMTNTNLVESFIISFFLFINITLFSLAVGGDFKSRKLKTILFDIKLF